jgi:hypothetical protein
MMSEDRKFLSQILKRQPLKGEEATALLRRLLRSQADGAADGHLAAGVALFAAAEIAPDIEKRLLYDQIFFCLMRALEDFAMLCLMGWDESRHPLDIYLNLDRPELRAFFARARKGLGDEVMFRLVGVAPWDVLKKQPAFKGKDFSADEAALDWAARDAQETLIRFGKLYHTTAEDADTELGPWQIAYARAPIGLKLLMNLESPETEMLLGSEQADPVSKLPPTVLSAPVQVDLNFAERLLHDLEGVCRQLKRLAQRRLVMLEDPGAVAPLVRAQWQEHLHALAKLHPRAAPAAEAPGAATQAPSPQAASPFPAAPPPPAPAPAAPAEPAEASKSSLVKPLAAEIDVHEEPRHDAPEKNILEVGGLKIIHSKPTKKP